MEVKWVANSDPVRKPLFHFLTAFCSINVTLRQSYGVKTKGCFQISISKLDCDF